MRRFLLLLVGIIFLLIIGSTLVFVLVESAIEGRHDLSRTVVALMIGFVLRGFWVPWEVRRATAKAAHATAKRSSLY